MFVYVFVAFSFCLILHICSVYVSSRAAVLFLCLNVVRFMEIVLLLAFENNVVNGFFHAFVSSLRLRSRFIYITSANGSGLSICSHLSFGAPLGFS